jgi:Carboxypeptidase regulatory-like domain/TonB dependent receptor
MSRLWAWVWMFSFLGGTILVGQTPDTVTLEGTVTGPTGAPASSAHITVTNDLTQLVRTAESDSSGHFTLSGLPTAGSYSVVVTREGFAPAQTAGVQLRAGSTALISFRLQVAGQVSTIEVRGSAGDVRLDEPQLGIFLSQEQMQQTPLINRRITYLPLLDAANRPAISQGDIFMNEDLFNTNGAGRRQTWFEVDGANAVDMWGRQTIFSNIPLMAVDEMAVLSNAYSTEYGAGTGSVVNIVTRSGGDQPHGQLLELWRPAGTEASLSGFSPGNATSGNEITSDVLGQTAASVSGPTGGSAKMHFFLAGEWNREAKASPVTSLLAPGSFVGHYRGWLGFLRLDRQINARHNAFLRVNFDNFTDTNPNGIVGGLSLPSVDRIFHRRTYTSEVGETAVLSPYLINNLRAQFQLASPITEFDPVIYSTEFSVPITSLCGTLACGTFASGTSQSALLMNRQYEGSETLAYARGQQQLVAGGSVVAAHNGGDSKEFGGPIYLGEFIFNPCSGTPAYCESSAYLDNINNVASYEQSYGNADYTVDDQLWSLFAQETYRATRRLSLSAGLRYERQTLTDAAKNFAPRAGFVWDLFGGGTVVFRGGFGIYYSQIVDNEVASYALGEPSGVFTYTATPGQVGFPSSIAAAPLPAFPAGAVAPIRSLYVSPGQAAYLDQYVPASVLNGYPSSLLSPYSQQYTAGVEARLAPNWVLDIDYVGTHTLRIIRPLDVDDPTPFVRTAQGQTRTAGEANCTRPYWIWWYAQKGISCNTSPSASYPQPPYSVIQTDVHDGYLHYNALDLNLTHAFSRSFSIVASYTWSHTLDNVDPDTTSQNPNDPNFTQHQEYGPAIYDQRHRAVISGVWVMPLKVNTGGVATLASALPFNYVTGTVNSGDTGATTDRPVIDGAVIGRNAGRGWPIYSLDPFLSRAFPIYRETVHLDLRAEAFNVLNHRNFVGYSGTYGNGLTPPPGFGAPLPGVTSQLPARMMQFSARVSF